MSPNGGERGGGLTSNPRPARRYPWGETPTLDAPDPNRANYGDSSIGATSAVGVFPGGVSPYGCLDVAGNVWEWCGTKWVDDYKKYDEIEGREALEGDATRVLRCAGRNWFNPRNRVNRRGFRVCVSTSFSPS
ncbi:MAG: SUMF1/EgtB/PvdO family nonheme iron enzyme [Anaerolineae bacterium]